MMTNATSTPEPISFLPRLLDLVLCAAMAVFSIAIGSVVGFMLIGPLVQLAGWSFQLSWLTDNGLNAGWLIGAGLGLAAAISKIVSETQKRRHSAFIKTACGKESIDDEADLQAAAGGQNVHNPSSKSNGESTAQRNQSKTHSHLKKYGSWKDRRAPSFRQFIFATGFLAFVGVLTGVMLGISLCLTLISVTTSPFVPDSWRPRIEQIEKNHGGSISTANSHREGGTSFQHPLLGPIMTWSILGMTSAGLVTGGFLSFFPDEKEKSKPDRARRKDKQISGDSEN